MKYVEKILFLGIAIVLTLTLFLASVEWVATSKIFYAYEFEKLGVFQEESVLINEKEMAEHIVGFLKNEDRKFQLTVKASGGGVSIFNERELLHMEDVRDLIDLGGKVVIVNLIVISLIFIFFRKRKDKIISIMKLSLFSYLLFLMLGLAAVTYDFNSYFIQFHEIFFNNDLWQLDVNKDLLLRIMPMQFFVDAFVYSMGIMLLINLVLGGIVWRAKRK